MKSNITKAERKIKRLLQEFQVILVSIYITNGRMGVTIFPTVSVFKIKKVYNNHSLNFIEVFLQLNS